MIQCVIFPDGKRVIVDQVSSYKNVGSDVIVEWGGGMADYTYTATSPALALKLVQSMDFAIQQGFKNWDMTLLVS